MTHVPHLQTPHSAEVLIEALDGNGLIASKKFSWLGISGTTELDGLISAIKLVIAGSIENIGSLTLS